MELTLPLWFVTISLVTLIVLSVFAVWEAVRAERRRLLGIIGRVMLKESFESYWADRLRYLLRDLGDDETENCRCPVISFRGRGIATPLPDEESGEPAPRSER